MNIVRILAELTEMKIDNASRIAVIFDAIVVDLVNNLIERSEFRSLYFAGGKFWGIIRIYLQLFYPFTQPLYFTRQTAL